mgnify:CR=1 FL=1
MSTGTPTRAGMTFSAGIDGIGGGEESTIDRSSAFDGVLRTARNLRVEGQAKGEVYCDGTLYIEEGGQVDARVVSANISVAGGLTGEILCHGKLQILPTVSVSGRVATASLVTVARFRPASTARTVRPISMDGDALQDAR